MRRSVTVLTHIPSPYQVEYFDAIVESEKIDLRVIYARTKNHARHWEVPALRHAHTYLENRATDLETINKWVDKSDLVVFSYYGNRAARRLMQRRANSGNGWCLWGERPGASWGVVGRIRRRLLLSDLARSRMSIWGIGTFAIEGWQAEFGNGRPYENVPYASNLDRFALVRGKKKEKAQNLLFSGSLILRKGIDLFAQAFLRLSQSRRNIRLDVIGAGELETSLRRILAPVQDRVRFWGFQQWDRLPSLYQAADILCVPSRYDGWGLVVPEGLAAGLPVIATDRMGAAIDLIQPGVNGWITRAGDEAGLEQTIRQVVEMSGDELDVMRRSAAMTARTHSLSSGVERFCAAVEATCQ